MPGDDATFMLIALDLARRAEAEGEVPVGAVVVLDGEVIGKGWNRNIALNDPTAHAEIIALREACAVAGNHRLPGGMLYVTLEPCCMCAGAMVHARLARVVYGTTDSKTGACGSVFRVLPSVLHNHALTVDGGVEAEACGELLRTFFRARR